MNTDLMLVTESPAVLAGLQQMMEALKGWEVGESIRSWMEVPPVLLLIEIMKRVEDKPEWFPHGKWATIQALQDRTDKAITAYLSSVTVEQ